MARAKKPEEKVKEGATLTIDVDTFVRTRDSVITGLATLQDAIQTLSSAYIKHTNTVLGEHGAGLEVDTALAKLVDNPLLGGSLSGLQRAVSPAKSTAEVAAEKKERKKRQHDPNAPKRPLTPFFLYMQTARPIIANDLGADFAKGAVSAEGTRRWGTMEPADKQLWTNAYKDNLRLYNARMHSYKTAHNVDAKDMTDAEAQAYADEHNIGAEPTADAQLVGEATTSALLDVDAEGEPEAEKEPTPPPAKATPKGKAGRKGKGAKEKEAEKAPEAIVPAVKETIVPPKVVEKEKSPDKKRKRASKAADKEPEAEKEELAVETPKTASKPRKKKAKGDS